MSTTFILIFFIFFISSNPCSGFGISKSVRPDTKDITSNLQKIAIIGEDSRDDIPWKYRKISEGIGVLSQTGAQNSWKCTAFCVAPNVIATNAHCIISSPSGKNPPNLNDIVFQIPPVKTFREGGVFSLLGSFSSVSTRDRASHLKAVEGGDPSLSIYSGDYRGSSSVRLQGQDWALAKLEKPICKGRALSFRDTSLEELRNASMQKQVFMIGFHGDTTMDTRRLSGNCMVFSTDDRTYFPSPQRQIVKKSGTLIPHDCDSVQGSSGSPIFVWTHEGPKVAGIHLGAFEHSKDIVRRHHYTGRIVERHAQKYRINMAVQPHAFLQGIERFQYENLLANLKHFRLVQKYLKILGFYHGYVDGIMGASTREAIRSYERKHNIAETGLPTEQLLSLLEAESKMGNE